MLSPDIEKRLQRLERSNRLYRIFLFIVLGASAYFITTGFTESRVVEEVIKAKEFQVVDSYGKVLMSLRKDAEAGQLDMYNTSGTKLLSLTTSDGGAGTIIGRDMNGKKIYRMINVKGGGGSVCVYNSNEVLSGDLTITDRNTGYLELNNSDGNKMLRFTYGNGSTAGIMSVYNSLGNRIIVMGSDASENGVLNVLNRYGEGMNGVWPK
jgi:hypothetical protein